ncbi:hypothetical protein A5844_000820 [Enterococcus sp. 10A9_DIV0425]|uniref:Gram-positive cocci surface proteins LPxTG domain-containing protein n=1 Tax=Candidatus Enterococcus wittei TaxID=1987383 RepID=A0A2C9XSA3_9ENTE|nr:bacterial Ig-like domain-containing protein [Enterococcus sp. 10A9_DIV0425]OTP12587.1 hypothetical protein A5844_000820 [Enterococcus sp. 10A9_DIV0425]
MNRKKILHLATSILITTNLSCNSMITTVVRAEVEDSEETTLSETDEVEEKTTSIEQETTISTTSEEATGTVKAITDEKINEKEVTEDDTKGNIPDPSERTECFELNGPAAISESDDIANGIFGTSPWRIDQHGVLYIGEGTLDATTMDARAPWFTQRSVIQKIVFTGPVVAHRDSIGLFFDLNQLTSIENLSYLDTSQVVDMSYFFAWCRQLTALDLSNFDTSKVLSMSHMFDGASALQRLDLTSFNTSNVTDMSQMFYGSISLDFLDISSFDTRNVTTMSYMFYNCSSLKELTVSHFETENVTDFNHMFGGCVNLGLLDVSGFVTSRATDLSFMFQNCSSLIDLDVTHFETSQVEYMHYMFYGCSGLKKLDVTNFDTANVTSMYYMFYGCADLTELDVSDFDTGKVRTTSYMFDGCENLKTIDVSNFNTENVRFMRGMFRNCMSLTELDLSNFQTDKVEWMQEMLAGTTVLSKLSLGVAIGFSSDADLPEIITSEHYTGKWQNVGNGTIDRPAGEHVLTSNELLTTYQGSMADTYVWQPIIGETIQAIDSLLYVGDTWQPIDNFVSATDKDGNLIEFEEGMVSGTVDTTKVGEYPVTYTNGSASQEIIVTVKENGETIEAKDSELYVGEEWRPSENFISATNKAGEPIEFEEGMVSGTVDTTKVGEYPVTYTNGDASQEIIVTVKENGETIEAKDSELYVGEEWRPSENFISATNKAGEPIEFEEEMVSGTVDTTKVGEYPVTYTNGDASKEIIVTVKENGETIEAKDSELYVGEEWRPSENFISATNKAGESITFEEVTVSGTVDTTKAGEYPVTYVNGNVTQTITVRVKESAELIQTRDTQLYVGDIWNARDNFVSATNKAGQPIEFKEDMVRGTVDTDKPGTYIVYFTNGKATATSQVTVVQKNTNETNNGDQNTDEPSQSETTGESNKNSNGKTSPTTPKINSSDAKSGLPKTGEKKSTAIFLGMGIVACVFVTFIYKKKRGQ